MNYKEMEDRLKSYINNGKYGWRKLAGPPMPTKDSYAMRGSVRDEIREQLTELDYRINKSPASKLALLEGAEKDPGNPRRNEVLGAEALELGDETEARERWMKALDAGSESAGSFTSLAVLESKRWLFD